MPDVTLLRSMRWELFCSEILEKQGLETMQGAEPGEGLQADGSTDMQRSQAVASGNSESKVEIRGAVSTASCETGIFAALKSKTGRPFSMATPHPSAGEVAAW